MGKSLYGPGLPMGNSKTKINFWSLMWDLMQAGIIIQFRFGKFFQSHMRLKWHVAISHLESEKNVAKQCYYFSFSLTEKLATALTLGVLGVGVIPVPKPSESPGL